MRYYLIIIIKINKIILILIYTILKYMSEKIFTLPFLRVFEKS
nr:MAG TPA: hypothetical protein [Caudoviricetes sp.]